MSAIYDAARDELSTRIVTPDWWTRSCDVTCTECGDKQRIKVCVAQPNDWMAESELRRQLNALGWIEHDGNDYCGDCAEAVLP